MKKLLIGIIGTILPLTGALKMSQPLKKNTQYNDLTVRYYLGMTFPKYNHPAKLYDEINLDKVDNIRKSKETISYYIGFYKDGKLIKFEKYSNDNKVMDFVYEYDEKGNLIKIYKNNIEVRKLLRKRRDKKKLVLVKLLKEVVMLSFYDCDKNLSENDFNEVEKKLEVSFPASFKSHYFKWNGGTPNLSCFANDNIDYDYIEIRDFIPMKYSKQFEDDPDFTLEGRAINEWKLNELPKNLIPFSFDWGGNYLCLEKNSWQIIYYVRDVWSENISREANFKKNSIIIAKSFDEFLNCLEENPDD